MKEEFEIAINARKFAYDPYTNYKVGCVLYTKSGKYYTGCNVANNGIQSICAERVAFVKAISEGEREFDHIVVVGGPKDGELEEGLPCGYCRQFMSEFVDKDFKIYTEKAEYTIEDLLPCSFKI